jgi:hypothetical protein
MQLSIFHYYFPVYLHEHCVIGHVSGKLCK